MKYISNKFLIPLSLFASLAISLPAVAGTYSQDFDGFADGTTDLGDGSVMAGTTKIVDGKLQLTENDVAGGFASFSIPPILESSGGWTATFDLLISDGEGANEPADGMSFNYGNAELGELGSAEEGMAGIATVSENISFEIDTWMNLDAEQGVNIAEKVDEVDTNLAFTNGPILEDGTEVSGQVTIVYDPVEGLSFSTTGLMTNADFENVETEFIGDDEYTFILSGRVGGANETKWIDNLLITTDAGGGADPDLVGWWPLTEGAGEELADATDNNLAAEFVDGEWISADDGDNVPGFLAGAMVASFDGEVTYALLGETLIPVMDETTPFTVAFWSNQVGGGTGVNEIVLGNRYMIDGADFAPREFIKFTPTQFEFHQEGVGNENVAYPDPIPDDEWVHHAIVKEGNNFTYYRNGTEANTFENSGAYPINPQPLFIGGQQPGGEHWSGALADIGLWSRNLSVDEIATIAADGIAALTGSTGPDILLTFNEGEELPEGTELVGNGEVLDENGVDDSGFLKITDAANGEKGAVIFPDLLNGKAVKSFKFTADFRVGGGTESPADGFSVNLVRPDDPILESLDGNGFAASPGGEANLPEEGSQTGLGIGFDEWDSAGGDVVGFSIRVDNELVAQIPADVRNGEPDDPQSLQTGPIGPDGPGDISELTWQQFEVELKEDGKVTIKWKGETVLNNFQTTFFPSPVQIVFAGRTGGANAAHHVDNIGLTIQPLDLLAVSRISSSTEGLAFELTDSDESTLDKESIALNVDGEMVTPTVTDGEEDGVTIITYASPVPYLPGTTHTYNLTANDMNGNAAVRSGAGEFSLKDSAMPYNTPLVGPDGEAGVWGVRYIWGAGTPGTTVGAIDLIQASDDADFPGEVYDTTMEVANHGTGAGYFPDDLPYPEDVEFGDDGLWDGENFVISYKGTLRITEGGLYTFGVHSDDGFGLRIFGAEFVSESGNGQLDPVVSDTVIHPAPTGDSNTRAVANLAPGDYPIEFFWYENGGGDNGEIYFAKGEFTEDADTEEWELIGPDHLVGPGALPFQITKIVKAGTDVSITWQSTEGAGYTIERASPEQLAEGDFEELQDGYEGEEGSTTFTDSEVADDELYYRVKAE